MSKKDQRALASALYQVRQDQLSKSAPLSTLSVIDETAGAIADALAGDSGKFDRSRFMLWTRTGKDR